MQLAELGRPFRWKRFLPPFSLLAARGGDIPAKTPAPFSFCPNVNPVNAVSRLVHRLNGYIATSLAALFFYADCCIAAEAEK